MSEAGPAADRRAWAGTDFTTTHWSVVLAAGQGDSPQAAEALERLCAGYWHPLYAFVRRQGCSPPDAEDRLQTFFACLLEKHYLNEVDRSKGRFRSFLLAALKHFLANEWDRARAQKRGGQIQFLSLEGELAEGRYSEEPAAEVTPERVYEKQWACVLLERVMERLEQDFNEAGKGHLFAALKGFLVGDRPSVSYAALAAKFETTEAALKMKVQRMRYRYQRLLREEIAQTVASPEEVEDEIRYLFSVLSC
jgi:DNA-directed RNA polymerase specialized sigma24 family protein